MMLKKLIYKLISTSLFFFAVSAYAVAADESDTPVTLNDAFSSPQIDSTLHGPVNESITITDMQDRLVNLAKKYATMTYVPYIWGGSKIGSVEECSACRACVSSRKLNLGARLKCEPCKRCGMDCSHFANHLFKEAGLSYNYASSSEFGRQNRSGLLSIYGFVDVGTDLSLAQPGDILVFPRHVAVLIRAIDSKHGDIIHSTRFRDGDFLKLGGIRYEINVNLKKYRGKLKRILRHSRLFEDKKNVSQNIALDQPFS